MEGIGKGLDAIVGFVTKGVESALSSVLETILEATLYKALYLIEVALCKIIGVLDQMFQVFAGITKVTYNGEKDYLLNIFFTNGTVSNVYFGMAMIGMAMCFLFAMIAVTRKLFDYSGTVQQSLGQILTVMIRSIITIFSMSAVMIIILNASNILMQQINYIFSDAQNLDIPVKMVYTDEQFALMGRVFNTIGNYSLNPSKSNRYNVNMCFNEIRSDLNNLQRQGVFRYYYEMDTDENGNPRVSWQSQLQKIVNAAPSLTRDVSLDVPYDALSSAILETMDILAKNASFKPLKEFSRMAPNGTSVPLDRYVFLIGTMRAANQDTYNANPSFDDPVRGPYYLGSKSYGDLDTVKGDFSISMRKMDYITVYFASVALIFDLVLIILNCVARIFNMLLLYIIAPPILAIQPLDNGGKTRQWMTAFIVQAFSVFGTVISMRLLLIYLPIIADSKLVLFDSVTVNFLGKLLLIYGGFETAKKSSGLLTGILADNAGMQSLMAGDMSGTASKITGAASGAALGAAKLGAKAVGFAAKPVTNVAKRPFQAAAHKWSKLGTGDRQREAANAVKSQIAQGKAQEAHLEKHPEDKKYLNSSGGDTSGSNTQFADFSDSSGSNSDNGGNSNSGNNNSGGPHPLPPPPPKPPSPSTNQARTGARRAKDTNSMETNRRPKLDAVQPVSKSKDDSSLNLASQSKHMTPDSFAAARQNNGAKKQSKDDSSASQSKRMTLDSFTARKENNSAKNPGENRIKDAESITPSRHMKLTLDD